MEVSDTIILKALLEADGGFVSGNALAHRLAVSRVAIWSQIKKLQSEGFAIEAKRNSGYRLPALPPMLHPRLLEALLAEPWTETPIHFHESVDSTNSEAERLLASGTEAPFVVIAREQTAGRGRLGRAWFSGSSGNLYLTFAFQPNLPPQRMTTFTLRMGVAVCHFLNESQEVPAFLKWPNDLLLDQKKIGGMLTEAKVDHDRIRNLIFGLGLNVNSRAQDLPADLQNLATSIAAATGKSRCIHRFTASLISTVLSTCRQFTAGENLDEFRKWWARYDALANQPVTARVGHDKIEGIARGIDADGHLRIERPDGSLFPVAAGDVTLRKP